MTELPRQSDREPVADLIAAAVDTRRVEDTISEAMRKAAQDHGRARADLTAEIVYGLLVDGDNLGDWAHALEVLGIALPPREVYATDYSIADRLGREFITWLYLVAMKR